MFYIYFVVLQCIANAHVLGRVEHGAVGGQLGMGQDGDFWHAVFSLSSLNTVTLDLPALARSSPWAIRCDDALVQMLEQLQEHAFIGVVIHRVTQ